MLQEPIMTNRDISHNLKSGGIPYQNYLDVGGKGVLLTVVTISAVVSENPAKLAEIVSLLKFFLVLSLEFLRLQIVLV
jgi:hypothetical protein